MTSQTVAQIISQAEEGARKHAPVSSTHSTRAAYAKGVRDMAALIIACANAAQRLCDEQAEASSAYVMLKGYADGLRNIADGADDLIPPGYEY